MKTIDERAEEYGRQGCGENCIFICEDWKDKNGVCSRLASRTALYKSIATEQEAIYNKRTEELFQYLEELEAHYRDLGQYDDGKPIRRVIEHIKETEE